MKDRTKLMFAEALEKMLETILLDKVKMPAIVWKRFPSYGGHFYVENL